jgi:hypothetical protein
MCSPDPGEFETFSRIEAILGRPVQALNLRTVSFPFIHDAATRRTPAACPDVVELLLPPGRHHRSSRP